MAWLEGTRNRQTKILRKCDKRAAIIVWVWQNAVYGHSEVLFGRAAVAGFHAGRPCCCSCAAF